MQRWRLLRIITARPRLFIGLAIGLLSYFPLMAVHPLANRIVLAWDIGIAVYLALTAEHQYQHRCAAAAGRRMEHFCADAAGRGDEPGGDFFVLARRRQENP
jgi:uncharacterized membrane protein